MAMIDDFAVDRVAQTIDAVAGTTIYSVEELIIYLQDLGDDLNSTGNDEYALHDDTIFTFKTVKNIALNGNWTLTTAASQRLYGGQISQANGGTVFRGVDIQGSVAAGTTVDIYQDNAKLTAFWGTGQAADPDNNIISRQGWILTSNYYVDRCAGLAMFMTSSQSLHRKMLTSSSCHRRWITLMRLALEP